MDPIPLPPLDEAKTYLREHFDEIVFGACAYTGPCAIGLLMTPEQRQALADAELDSTYISVLFDYGTVVANNDDDQDWYMKVQSVVDSDAPDLLKKLLD